MTSYLGRTVVISKGQRLLIVEQAKQKEAMKCDIGSYVARSVEDIGLVTVSLQLASSFRLVSRTTAEAQASSIL